ncbi:VRR-NUC domain-containing protein [Siminovitchia fortis]|uniref:VRR-NUC domain-containing protein n=1 Tax=Siminovitchia fortis TaxID=254758 RepID=UPI0027B88C74|nr:VRR-NUC domain-containing protein [Siminovitchia fortis]
MIREKDIENYLRNQVKKIGGIAYKFESPGNAGVPDRLVLLPGGRVHFVELKAPGKKPTALQLAQHRKINKLHSRVLIIDSKEKVDRFIEWVTQSEI